MPRKDNSRFWAKIWPFQNIQLFEVSTVSTHTPKLSVTTSRVYSSHARHVYTHTCGDDSFFVHISRYITHACTCTCGVASMSHVNQHVAYGVVITFLWTNTPLTLVLSKPVSFVTPITSATDKQPGSPLYPCTCTCLPTWYMYPHACTCTCYMPPYEQWWTCANNYPWLHI